MMEPELHIPTDIPEVPTLLQFWASSAFINDLTPYIKEGETLAHVLVRASARYHRLKQEDAAGDPSGIVAQVRSLFANESLQ